MKAHIFNIGLWPCFSSQLHSLHMRGKSLYEVRVFAVVEMRDTPPPSLPWLWLTPPRISSIHLPPPPPPPSSESILQGSSVGPDRFLSTYNQNKDRQYKASKLVQLVQCLHPLPSSGCSLLQQRWGLIQPDMTDVIIHSSLHLICNEPRILMLQNKRLIAKQIID